MRDREKRTCQNPNHPFKQKWYWYKKSEGEYAYLDNPDYCVSCASYFSFLKTMLKVMLQPTGTLYGDAMIHTDKEQLKKLVEEL